MKIVLEIICLAILSTPLLWEIRDDAKGDINKMQDVLYRGALMIASGAVVDLLTYHTFLASCLMSFAIFFLIFDYWVNVKLNQNVYDQKVNVFTHLGKSSVLDRWKWWAKSPWWRLIIRLEILVLAMVMYF